MIVNIIAVILAIAVMQIFFSRIESNFHKSLISKSILIYNRILSPPIYLKSSLIKWAVKHADIHMINGFFKIMQASRYYNGIVVIRKNHIIYEKDANIPKVYIDQLLKWNKKTPLVFRQGNKLIGTHVIHLYPGSAVILTFLPQKAVKLCHSILMSPSVQNIRPKSALASYPLRGFNNTIEGYIVFRLTDWGEYLYKGLHTLTSMYYISIAALALFILYLWGNTYKLNRYLYAASETEEDKKTAVMKEVAASAIKYRIYRQAMITAVNKKSAKETLSTICNQIADILDAGYWTIIFLSENRSKWRLFAHSSNLDKECIYKSVEKIKETSNTHIDVTLNAKSVVVSKRHIPEQECPIRETGAHPEKIKMALDLPIIIGEEVTAVFSFFWGHEKRIKKEDIEILLDIQKTITELITSAYAIQDIHWQSLKDPLLGIYNKYIIQYSKKNVKGSVLFIDLDNFKQVNDKFGHKQGDAVLKTVVTLIRKSLRSEDTIIRYGGDEFVVVLQNTEPKSATQIAERIRKLIADTLSKFNVTASIGIKEIGEGKSLEDTIAEADKVMYRAKELGKNRVICC